MIKLFITDIDGCLSVPFQTPDWDTISAIRSLNRQSKHQPEIPPLTICSGRPFPYVEAVAQWLDIRLPMAFESAGIFDPTDYSISINKAFDEDGHRHIEELKGWMKDEIIAHEEGMVPEFAKLMDAGLIHPQREVIQRVLPEVSKYVATKYPLFETHWTDVSINVVLKQNNKQAGIQDICSRLNVDLSEVAYIGDSTGDIPGLKQVGYPFAPENAYDEVKEVAKTMPFETTKAVLKAYEKLIDENSKLVNR